MAWYGLVLKQAERSIGNTNNHIEDLKNKNKELQAKVDDLNKANASALSDFSKAFEGKNNLEGTITNQEASI